MVKNTGTTEQKEINIKKDRQKLMRETPESLNRDPLTRRCGDRGWVGGTKR